MARARSDEAFSPQGPIRSMTYGLLWRAIGALERLANACLYVAVGLLRKEDLRNASQTRWSLFHLPDEDVEAGLEPWEQRLYFSLLRGNDRVLIVGCGGGRDLLPFCARGCIVTGVEAVPALVATTRRHLDRLSMNAALIEAPIETAELSGTFDLVIFSAFVYGYISGASSRVSTLQRLKSHLSPGGRIVLHYTKAIPRARLGLWLTRLTGWVTRNDWTPDSEDAFFRGPHRLPFYERRLTDAAVRRELAEAGLQVVGDECTGTRHSVIAAAAV